MGSQGNVSRPMFTARGRVAVLAAVAALAAAGCGDDSGSSGDSGGSAAPATTNESAVEPPIGGGSSGDPDCQSKKDPQTGMYQKTPEKCHFQDGP